MLNYAFTVFGLWYSAKLFKDNGWTVPTTWADFTALLDKIKAKGITPYGYAGANAPYYQYTVILTSAAKIGGADSPQEHRQPRGRRLDATTPSSRPPQAWAEVGAKYSDKAFLGLKHTEVQLQQNQYKVGFYPSRLLAGERAGQGHPGRLRLRSHADPERHRARTSCRPPRSTPPPASSTSSPARARTRAAAWSTCATCSRKAGAMGFTELTKSLDRRHRRHRRHGRSRPA